MEKTITFFRKKRGINTNAVFRVFFAALFFLTTGAFAQQFTDGNLAAVVAAASANNTTASVIEVTPSTANQSSPVNTFAISGSDIRVSGSATSTLYVANSADGSQLLLTGHYSPTTSGNANALLPRGVIRFKHAGGAYAIPTTYTGSNGNQTRCATTLDNTNYYIADQGGLYTNGSTTATQSTNLRSVKPFGGTVYGFAASSSVIAVGTFGVPAGPTATTYTGLSGVSAESSGQDFYMISSNNNGVYDVLYVLTATSNTVGIIKKFSLVSGTWTANGSYTTTFGGFGLCARKEGTNTQLYITTGQGALTANKIMRVTDTAGYNSNIAVTTANNLTLYTAASGTIIKGIAFAPLATPPAITSSLTATAQVGQSFSYQITANAVVTAYAATGLTGTGLSINTATGVISGIPTTTAGSPINVTVSATNTEGTGSATLVLTINKANQIITFDPLASVNNGAADFDLTATASSNLAVSYTSSNTAVATVTGSTVHVVGVGSTDITASQPGNADYNAADSVIQTLTVNSTALANQTITFPAISDKVYGDASFTLGATASSNLAVTYTSSDADVATVSGNTVTIVGVGEVTIYADQEGNSQYNPAPEESNTFTVTAKSLTVTGAAVTTKVYDTTDVATITGASLNGVVPGDTVTVSGNGTFADANAGENKTVTAALVLGGDDSANYTLVQPALTGTITKADQVITFGAIPAKNTLDADFAPGATSATSAVNAIEYTSSNTAVATIVSGNIHIVGAGTSTITATQAESQNYNAATAVIQTLTVTAAQFTGGNIVVLRIGSGSAAPTSAANPVYFSEYTTGGTATVTIPVPTATAGSRLVMSGSATSEGQLSLSGDGQYLTVAGYDAAVGTTSIASTTATVANRIVARASANGQVAFTSLGTSAYSSNNVRSAVTQDGTRYWTAGATGGIYSVEHQGTTTTLVSSTIANTRTASIFNNQLYFSTGSGTPGIYKVGTGLPATASTVATSFVGTGTGTSPYAYALIDRGGNNRNMYIIDSASGLRKFSSNDGGATWTAQGVIAPPVGSYGLAARLVDATVEVYVSSEAAIYKLVDANAFDAAVSASFSTIVTAPANTRFRGIAFAPSLTAPVVTNTNLEIAGALNQPIADYTITAVNAPASYNATGLPDGVTVNTQTGVISGAPQHAGTYEITISATNAAGTGTKILTLNVAKGDQSITFDALPAKDVNDADFALTATSATSAINPITYTSSNVAVATVTGSTVHIVGVGSTVITASQAATSDYNAAPSVQQTLVVTSASLINQTITFDALADQVYGNPTFELNATASSGLAVTYTSADPTIASVTGNVVTILNVGTVNITASQAGDSTYNAATDVVQPLTILAKPLTVTGAAVTTRAYSSSDITATITGATLEGVIAPDAVTLVNNGGTYADANAGTDKPVTSNFTLTGAQAYRYTIVQPALTGTITKANQTITFATFPLKSTLEPVMTLTSFSGTSAINPVTYTSSNPLIATVSGTTLTIVSPGFVTITASQAESANYNAATIAQTLTVQEGIYLNQFTGASACPTNGNVATTASNTAGSDVSRTTITCQSTGNVFNSTTLNNTAAVNETSYIEFSVTADAGYMLNLTSLYMMRQASNSAPNQLEIRYSTDDFATYSSFTASPSITSSNSPTAPAAYTLWDFADFSTPLGGTVTFRLYPYGTQRVDGTGVSATSGTFRIDDVTVFGTTTKCYDWTGAVSTDWNDAANWCGSEVPTATADVNIPATANNPVIASGIAYAHNLTIAPGAALTVNTGATISVDNILDVDATATLTIQDNAALLQGEDTVANANSGNITLVKKSNPLYRLDYTLWSSPVTGQSLYDFSPATSSTRFYEYKYDTNGTTYLEAYWPLASSTQFTAAKAFLIRMPNVLSGNVTGTTNGGTTTPEQYIAGNGNYFYNGTFNGAPNNGTITYPLSTIGDKYTAVGNPYPSPISLVEFFDENNDVMDISSGIYFWRKRNNSANSSYATLSLGGYVANPQDGGATDMSSFFTGSNTDWTLAPGQGFLVKTQASLSTAAVTFTNAMRTASPGASQAFFKSAGSTASRLWLNLAAESGMVSQTMVGYFNNATMGLDYGFDAKKFTDGNTVAFYSLAEATPLAIQARPGFEAADVVPMGFTVPTAGTFTVTLDHVDGVFANGQKIYLRDNQEGIIHNMANSYTFSSEAGTFEGRFDVIYTTEALGTNNPALESNKVMVYTEGKVIGINSGNAMMNNVTIYDIRGRKLYSQAGINDTQVKISNLTAEQQVLIVEVDTVNGKVSKRIVF